MLLDCNGIKLEINNKKIAGKAPNAWKLNSTVLSNTQVKKYFEINGEVLEMNVCDGCATL